MKNPRQVLPKRFFIAAVLIAFAPVLFLPSSLFSDSVKPYNSGPFFLNHMNFTGSPRGYDYVLTNGFYHFQIGWLEPISPGNSGLFKETYFETDGNFNVSPFQSDIGTTFNLKPIRYFEIGLSYNRLLFHNSMVTWDADTTPSLTDWRPNTILMKNDADIGGADVFTFQGNFTFDLGPTQFYFFGSRALWDIDAKGKQFVYEYGNDILIKPRDRVSTLLAQCSFDLQPYSVTRHFSYSGFAIRDQYSTTSRTSLDKNLISVGITGFRIGQNPAGQKRGLDLSLGYFTLHPQIPVDDWTKRLVLLADWKWNVQFLKM